MPKKSRQKFKYLENEKSFWNEIKSIFHHFWRAIIEVIKKIFLEGESPTLNNTESELKKWVAYKKPCIYLFYDSECILLLWPWKSHYTLVSSPVPYHNAFKIKENLNQYPRKFSLTLCNYFRKTANEILSYYHRNATTKFLSEHFHTQLWV